MAFLLMGVMVALVAAGQISAARGEEAEGRLDNLLVRPVSRPSWLVWRLVVAAVAVLAGGLIAGAFTWLGAASQHSGVSFAHVFDAGLNVVPPAVCVLGAGTLALGVWPRAATVTTYGLVVWSFLIELVGGIVGLNHWVLDTSVFHQMNAAPAVSPDWASGGALLALGVGAALVGGIAFRIRDLVGA